MKSSNLRIKISLFLNYFVFAILLNSVGIVILKAQKVYGVDQVEVSILEFYKDIPIAVVSFLVASFLPRFGYKKSMLTGLAIVTFASIGMYFGNSFLASKLLFLCVGVSFALIKVSVYATIGLVTNNQNEHNSLMSSIEGFFMVGITFAYFLFPFFNIENDPNAWVDVYLFLALLSTISFIFLWTSEFQENIDIPERKIADDFVEMITLIGHLSVIVFLISAFLFVMIEQGIMTWLPTFNNTVLEVPENLAIIMTSILFIASAVGRLLAGQLVKKISWFWILLFCIFCVALILLFILPRAISSKIVGVQSLLDIPFYGYAFPLVGLFLAPIYPLINSVILSALPKNLHSPMAGLIIVFSAVGGTVGSRLIGYLFKSVGAESAFTYVLIPLVFLLILLSVLYIVTNNKKLQGDI